MAARPNAGTKGVPRADRERQILAVASVAFGTHGFVGTNVADVARAAGISKPLVYAYFGSKEGLYAACLDRAGALLGDEIERVARGDVVGLERGVRTLEGMFDVLEDQRHVWRLLHDRSAPSTPEVATVVAAHTDRIHALAHEGVSELLALAGVQDGLDVSAMTATWLGIVDSLMDWWVAHPEQSAADMVERVTRLVAALFTDAAGATR
ncbi:TetR/AcrR family transcriptional regulator [Aeromicrobium erythreum]|jgi:AcrR family transcriptional regulator|uniref:TetR family transcriptional regulator n=1 Tax=Aeromicrobium erythreum TaxID=2041 RepID=A0A0U4C686_9ACTN|nr:TetR/AcrR family transcriptional regulator [Aeromicrobium erythreum]ALX03675.1 TetR family transcriptional regulator [Aeromicrobium erythreum]